jgi:hypothetical protein
VRWIAGYYWRDKVTKLMRDEFEASRIDDGIDPEELWLDTESGDYICDEQIYWQIWQSAWKKSRETLVIDLPTTKDNGTLTSGVIQGVLHAVKCKLNDAGVLTK